ncbi:MAG TPA: hypothetical protein VNB91_05035, partial [Jatrophihabitantaceae bacterium]|nr:hypothetical protein [Jatrophihabitantaceae bacterium]
MERRQRRRPGNLPAEVTSFVGRTADLQAARGLIGEARLVTLIGAGGVGKTRLAVRLGEELGRGFPGGVWLVDLAQVAEGADVAATVSATIADVLDHRAALLILDGCEPRLDDCATVVADLLHATTAVWVLTTSRQPLGVLGEHLLEVGPMATPAPGTSVDRLRDSDAVALFLERVSAATPSFVLTDDTASAVVRLCRRVGGLPLALELAAIRLHALALDELLSQLADPRQLMRLHSRSPQPRQRSLDASHGWSHALCSAAEQRLWARLAVFPERFDLDAARAVCAGVDHGRTEIAESLAGLVEKSVVHRTDAGSTLSGSTLSGYRSAPTAREFGELLLDDNGDREVFRQRHASHFLATARRLVADLHSGGPAETVAAVHHDHENLATATDQLLSHGEAQSALTPATLLCLC